MPSQQNLLPETITLFAAAGRCALLSGYNPHICRSNRLLIAELDLGTRCAAKKLDDEDKAAI